MRGRSSRGESAVIAALLSLLCTLLVGPVDAFLGDPAEEEDKSVRANLKYRVTAEIIHGFHIPFPP
jgi:hypothetical protein